MKPDGHAKITNAAVSEFRLRCSKASIGLFKNLVCKLPQYSTWELPWNEPGRSNLIDSTFVSYLIISQEFGDLAWGIGENTHLLSNGYITRETVAVDIEYISSHFKDSEQRFHFMRPTNQTVKKAYEESVDFIKTRAEIWLYNINRSLFDYSRGGWRKVFTLPKRRNAVSNLAMALHSLQDSFSPGHTKRGKPSRSDQPGSIEHIYIFKGGDEHSAHDYESGSLNSSESMSARSAVLASADLLELCATAAANRSNTIDNWKAFQNKWIKLSSKVKK